MSARLIAASVGVGALVLALLVEPEPVNGTISGSPHDFSSLGWSQGPSGSGEICAPCHTPHNADTTVTDAPLWNHAVTTATYALYSSATLDAAPSDPAGVAKLCLSCHDGTVALDSFGGATGSTFLSGASNLGTDLSEDHPVSFTYDTSLAAADGGLVDPAGDGDGDPSTVGMVAPYLPLYGGLLTCGSCHDVHNAGLGESLLYVSNAGSALCLRCHTK